MNQLDPGALHAALLPAGLHDLLPPEAGREAVTVEAVLKLFGSHGYERVKPPLVEFEQNLLAGVGQASRDQLFRLLDPLSQRMMAVRADVTPQIARISAARLGRAPRPLRLAYSGEVLRVAGDQLRPERQFRQVGCELIGSLAPAADAEIVGLAVGALAGLGLGNLSVDLNLPTLVPILLADAAPDRTELQALTQSLERRDVGAMRAIGTKLSETLAELLALAGPVPQALARFQKLTLPAAAEPDRARLIAVVALLQKTVPALSLTIDLVERRGFEYQTGLSYTLFARGVRGELGRGGRYRVAASDEPAVGVTLFTDTLLRALPAAVQAPRLYVPAGADATAQRAEGWITVAGLEPVADVLLEAKRLNCSHALVDGAARGI